MRRELCVRVLGAAVLGVVAGLWPASGVLMAQDKPAAAEKADATKSANGKSADAKPAAKPAKPAEPKPDAALAIATAVEPSLVRVEYTLQYDKGEAPSAFGWSERCPNCGGYHGSNVESVVTEERPFEAAGFLIGGKQVITADPLINPRFVKSIAVRFGDETVNAKPAGFAKNQAALLLTLDKPIKAAKPLKFDAARKGPYSAVTYSGAGGDWTIRVAPAGGPVSVTTSDRKFMAVPSFSLLTDAKGNPVGMSMKDEVSVDDSWKGSPADWPIHSAGELASINDRLKKTVEQGLVRVTLNFRSPKASAEDRFGGMRMSPNGDDENATVRHATGVLLDDKSVLVLMDLKAKQTARLENVRVQAGGNEAVEAKFDRTISDYGALVVKLDKPLPGAVKPAKPESLLSLRGELLPAVELVLQGDQRTEFYDHRRIPGFRVGWKRQLTPDLPGGGKGQTFLFNAAGELVALPIARRDKTVDDDRFSYSPRQQGQVTPAEYVWPVVTGDAAKYADAGNVPLTEEQESRIAWLGVELQQLTPDLARENSVSHLTSDGQTGALVTYVYPDSPAAKAGIEPGNILLRLHVPDQPKPIDVRTEPSMYGDQPFPWDRFDELPEQYFDQIPKPWPSVESQLNRSLTDVGFDKKFELELAADGKVEKKPFTVAQGPRHYDSAEKYKFDPLGITVKDLTYEVRRYFQIPEGEPGVIIGKIEMGSRASTSGLKPYELVTHVNDEPVTSVKEFEQKVKDLESVRLSIKRMTKGRQVNIILTGKPPAPAKPAGAEGPEAAEPEAAEPAK